MKINIPVINTNYNKYTYTKSQSFKANSDNKDNFELSVGYVNDIHGQTNNMLRILSGLKGDLKLSAGDNDIGDEKNTKVHKATATFLNKSGIVATALGNHELDTTQDDFLNTMNSMNTKVLTTNIQKKKDWKMPDNNADKCDMRDDFIDKLNRSVIVDVKGERIGLIGTSPMDLSDKLTHPYYYDDCRVENLEDTINEVQLEVNKLKDKGINKIFLLSHLGLENDKILAQKTDGIDVIHSGHTHELIKGITEGENLLYSASGEPVILTEVGKNGNNFGLLNLTFNKEGVITKAQNNIANTGVFHKNMINQYAFNEILGKPENIGVIKQAPPPPQTLTEENPHANFVCDAMQYETKADIALWHHTGVRGYFHEGIIDSSEVKDMAPFLDRVVTAKISEKNIVEAMKTIIKNAYLEQKHKPGLLAVAGLEYTVNKNKGELVSMNFVDTNGNKIPIDIEHPDEAKFYIVAMDEFLMEAGADYPKFGELDDCLEIYPYDKDVMTCNYIKALNQPIVINQTGRVKFV